ncbi:MAG: hypothetical protein QOI09_2574 [Chloroflexota bacterium]|nr:hypothetical protein [Chloroflexota bacterium]
MNSGAAQAWFIAGTIPFIVGGGAHVLATLLDTVRPTFFTPIDASAKPAVEGTGIRLVRMFGVSGTRPSMWRVWLGMNVSHGLGVFTFGLLCLLIASHDFTLVERIDAIRPVTIAFSAAYVALSLRFWFYGALIISGRATACFTVAAVLSA